MPLSERLLSHRRCNSVAEMVEKIFYVVVVGMNIVTK